MLLKEVHIVHTHQGCFRFLSCFETDLFQQASVVDVKLPKEAHHITRS